MSYFTGSQIFDNRCKRSLLTTFDKKAMKSGSVPAPAGPSFPSQRPARTTNQCASAQRALHAPRILHVQSAV